MIFFLKLENHCFELPILPMIQKTPIELITQIKTQFGFTQPWSTEKLLQFRLLTQSIFSDALLQRIFLTHLVLHLSSKLPYHQKGAFQLLITPQDAMLINTITWNSIKKSSLFKKSSLAKSMPNHNRSQPCSK